MFGIPPVAPLLLNQYETATDRTPTNRGTPPSGKSIRPTDALAILLVWGVFVCLSLFVQPNYDDASAAELLYYTIYNVAIGSFVGFYLLDRLPQDGYALFALRASTAILLGTLLNETVVEPAAFGLGYINGEGVYYGLKDSISSAGIFLLLRLGEWLHVLQRRSHSELERSGPDPRLTSSTSDADSNCFFVRVAHGTHRIYAPDVVYMKAERDFTRVVCVNGEQFVSESLKNLLKKSAAFGLIRTHKSFAVNLSRVERLTRTEVQVGDQRVPVGRRYRPAFAESWRSHSAPFAEH